MSRPRLVSQSFQHTYVKESSTCHQNCCQQSRVLNRLKLSYVVLISRHPLFGCNTLDPVYGSKIDRAQIKVRMMCSSRVRWACLAHIGSMLVNSVQPAVGSEVAEAGAGPRFPVLCLPTVAEHPGGREREREWLPCSAQGSLASSYVPSQGIERPLLRAAAD